MKNAVKYLVLSISSVMCFVVLFLMVALLLDIGSLSYPATLIFPLVSFSLLIGGFVFLTIWAFKFSNNKAHKKFLIISISVFLASAVVFLSAQIVNPVISQEAEQTEEEKLYFDFTVSDFVDTLSEEYFTHLTFISTVPTDDGTIINTYTLGSGEDNLAPMVHYLISYDEITEKVSHISFFLNKEFETDLPDLVLAHYFINVGVVASVIEPDIDTSVLMDEIAKGFKGNELDSALCDREKFTLYACNTDSYFDASFTPIKERG